MTSTASTTWQDYIEGKLITQITTSTTTGVTVKIKQVNGVTPTWPTAAHRIKIVQRTATNNKVEKSGVAAGTTQSGQTVTLGTLSRALSLSDGTNFSASAGTAQSFSAGADVFITWDNHDAAQTAKIDLANTFTDNQTLSTTKELRLGSSATAVWKDGSDNLSFKDAANGTKTLTELSAAAGVDEKAKVSANDTTQGYLNGKLVAGAGITLTENNDGSNETLSVIAANTVATGHTGLATITSGGLMVGAGTSNVTIIGPGTSGQIPTSNGTTIAMATPKPLNILNSIGLQSITLTDATAADLQGQVTIGAGTMVAGTRIELLWTGTTTMNGGHAAVWTFYIGALSFAVTVTNTGAYTDNPFSVKGSITCLVTGASGKIIYDFETQTIGSATAKVRTMSTAASTLDTTASNLIKIAVAGDGSGASGNVKQYLAIANQYN